MLQLGKSLRQIKNYKMLKPVLPNCFRWTWLKPQFGGLKMSYSTVTPQEIHLGQTELPDYIREPIQNVLNKHQLNSLSERIFMSLEYTLPRCKNQALLISLLTYKDLMESQGLKAVDLRRAQILGWCVELLHMSLLIFDDIMDHGTLRYGQLCWHKLEHIGMSGINDGLIIENIIYFVLHEYFGDKEYYVELCNLMREVTLITAYGQLMDLMVSQGSIALFTKEMFRDISDRKTALSAFYLPLALPMHLAG
uniref:Uncharacterized protein n=2 Tax=Stomoxys calcitrans TaxID=35570 RepID=A0A1I8Q214_STOCA